LRTRKKQKFLEGREGQARQLYCIESEGGGDRHSAESEGQGGDPQRGTVEKLRNANLDGGEKGRGERERKRGGGGGEGEGEKNRGKTKRERKKRKRKRGEGGGGGRGRSGERGGGRRGERIKG